jgi:hypothetical protein
LDLLFNSDFGKPTDDDSGDELVMDECSAAMVLMSLSCSPKMPHLLKGNPIFVHFSFPALSAARPLNCVYLGICLLPKIT